MHELSLAMEVISLAEHEAGKQGLSRIIELVVEVGDLSGVDADSFRFGLEMLTGDSLHRGTEIIVRQVPGRGLCSACGTEYQMHQRLETCPSCNGYASVITGGEAFRLVSVVAE